MRSKLVVPGSRPELFAKALASKADAVSLDREDAVDPRAKDSARQQLCDFLRVLEPTMCNGRLHECSGAATGRISPNNASPMMGNLPIC